MKKSKEIIAALAMVILTLAGCKTKAPLPTTTIFTNAGERELPLVTMLVDFAALIEGNDIRSFSPWLLILMWPPMCPQIMACRGRGPKHARKCWILAAPPWLLPPRGAGETAFSGLTPTAPMAVATSAIL